MKHTNLVYIQPIAIHDYQQFRLYAKRARMVTFETQYYDTPFIEEGAFEPAQRLKALKIWAIGVTIDGLPLTLVHTIEFPWIPLDAEDWEARTDLTGQRLALIMEELETDLQAVPGNPSPPSIRELWVKTLR